MFWGDILPNQIHNIISNVGYTQRLIENINEYHTMN